MTPPDVAAIAANRFGLGARPGELARIDTDPDSARQGLLAQLKDRPPVLQESGLQPSADILARAIALRRELAEDRRDRKTDPAATEAEAVKVKAAMRLPRLYLPVYLAEAQARLAHAVSTDRPFLERLTQFWSNHFAVSVDKIVVLGLAGTLEREAIRPHVTGNFADLLLAVEQHPAMLLYLDNAASIGPDSRVARLAARRARRKVGINENLAREILELHTLGVNGGYSQADVTTFAQAITGWSVSGETSGRLARLEDQDGPPGMFLFRESFHEPGSRTLLGKRYADSGVEQGRAILRDLALRAETARHLCGKLARHFIADEPPRAVVERMTRAWLDTRGHLPTIHRVMVEAPESWSVAQAKFKTPADYLHSVFRGLDMPLREPRRSAQAFEVLGQRPWSPGSPAGWPDVSADWDGPSALLRRISWADALVQRLGDQHHARELAPQLLGGHMSEATATAVARAENAGQALTLLLASPEFMRR